MRTAAALVAVLLVGLACGGGGTGPPPEPPLVVPVVVPEMPVPVATYPIVAMDDVMLTTEERAADASGWTSLGTLDDIPGRPAHYEAYEGGGEGDCAIRVLQFMDGTTILSRLFYVSSCFGDSFSEDTAPVALSAGTFSIRSDVNRIENIEWTDEGVPTGDPVHEQIDHPYTWDGKSLTAGPETTTTLE